MADFALGAAVATDACCAPDWEAAKTRRRLAEGRAGDAVPPVGDRSLRADATGAAEGLLPDVDGMAACSASLVVIEAVVRAACAQQGRGIITADAEQTGVAKRDADASLGSNRPATRGCCANNACISRVIWCAVWLVREREAARNAYIWCTQVPEQYCD